MDRIKYTESREARFTEAMSRVCADHKPMLIERSDQPPVVLLSLEDYESLARGGTEPARPPN